MHPYEESDAAAVTAHVKRTIGDPSLVAVPYGFPNSLALCVLDAIWSLGANYDTHVANVHANYRRWRANEGANGDTDNLGELLGVFDRARGPAAFAEQVVRNRQRTWANVQAPLKATAVFDAATVLVAEGVNTVPDMLRAVQRDHQRLKARWRTVPGQRTSFTGWRYLLMLIGLDEIKPDRMIRRFVAAAIGRADVPDTVAADLVAEAATRLGVTRLALDNAIWRYQSGRHPEKTASSNA